MSTATDILAIGAASCSVAWPVTLGTVAVLLHKRARVTVAAAAQQASPQASPNGQPTGPAALVPRAALTQREAGFWRFRDEGKTVAEARELAKVPETTARRYEKRRAAALDGAPAGTAGAS